MTSATNSRDYGYKANVFIWNTTVGNEEGIGTKVGHASIELQKPPQNSSLPIENKYFSFRPKCPGLVNPFLFFLPSAAKSYTSIDQDRIHEGSDDKLKDPDQTFSIPISERQYEQMNTKIDAMKKDTDEGKLLYHLFPRVSVLPAAKALASRRGYEALSECPFSGLPMGDDRYKDMEGMQQLSASHCALTVNEVLSAGDIPVSQKTSRFAPWVMTPTDLGRSLQER